MAGGARGTNIPQTGGQSGGQTMPFSLGGGQAMPQFNPNFSMPPNISGGQFNPGSGSGGPAMPPQLSQPMPAPAPQISQPMPYAGVMGGPESAYQDMARAAVMPQANPSMQDLSQLQAMQEQGNAQNMGRAFPFPMDARFQQNPGMTPRMMGRYQDMRGRPDIQGNPNSIPMPRQRVNPR